MRLPANRCLPAALLLGVLVVQSSAQSPAANPDCTTVGSDTAAIPLPTLRLPDSCATLQAGFADISGSFARLTADFGRPRLMLSLSGEFGVRLRRAQIGVETNSLLGKPLDAGLTVYGQLFRYDEARDPSLLAFDRDVQPFNSSGYSPWPQRYKVDSYGVALFTGHHPTPHSRLDLAWNYDVSNVRTLSDSARDYFRYLRFTSSGADNDFSGIRTSALTPSFTWSAIDNPASPAHGASLRAAVAVAGLGGNVNTVEPLLDAKYFRPGFHHGQTLAIHLRGQMITGYAGSAPPPIRRYYAGGEDDIRGFDSWSISPIAGIPGVAQLPVLNPDGSQRIQKQLINNQLVSVLQTMSVPVDWILASGGDTKLTGNLEYRVHLRGPFSLIIFADTVLNRVTFRSQLRGVPARVADIDAQFPSAAFPVRAADIYGGSQDPRMSVGPELQFLLKKPSVPIRFYWAYNPLIFEGYAQPRVVADFSSFPNAATLNSFLAQFGSPVLWQERRSMFRFSIGRTF